MPRTHVAFLVGILALVGIPPFAGFWSKDGDHLVGARDAAARSAGTLYVAGLVGALLTGAVRVPPLLHGLPRRAERARRWRTHTRATARGRSRCSCRSASSPCSRRSAGCSSSPASGSRSWTGSARRAEPLVEPTTAQDYGTSAIAVTLGLVGLCLARRAFYAGRQLVTSPGAWRVLEHKLYFDELYDALFYRPAVGALDRAAAQRRGAARRALARRDRRRDDPGRRRGRSGPVRAPPHVRGRHRLRGRRARRRLRSGALSRARRPLLIVLPIAARARRRDPPAATRDDGRARVPRSAHRGRALDRRRVTSTTSTRAGSSSRTSHEWVESLGISYSVGFYGFSLWLAGAAVIVFAAAIGYALWVGRDRPRAYHALMLFLTGAVVATFAAQDLLLFYVSFEAMLIPLYVLVGVWGGERRQAATLTFVIYTMAGLAAHARLGRRVRRHAGHVLAHRVGDERQRLDLPRLRGRIRRQGAALPVPRLASARVPRRRRSRSRRSSRRSSRRRRSTASCASGSRSSPTRPTTSPGSSSSSRGAGLVYGSRARVPRARPARNRRVLVDGADGADHARGLRVRRPRDRRRDPPVGRTRAHLGGDVPPRRHGRATLRHR